MICENCNQEKDKHDFYFLDGGLGYSNMLMHWCKECTQKYNKDKSTKYKYTDEQLYPFYYGALSVIEGRSINETANLIQNGIEKSSNYMGIQNMLFLITDGDKGLSQYSKQQKAVFEKLNKNV